MASGSSSTPYDQYGHDNDMIDPDDGMSSPFTVHFSRLRLSYPQ